MYFKATNATWHISITYKQCFMLTC